MSHGDSGEGSLRSSRQASGGGVAVSLTTGPATPPIDVWLDAEGAVIDPHTATGFVADLHLGKSTTFRRAGIGVPTGSSGADLERLERVVRRHALRRLWVLGDLVHASSSWSHELDSAVAAWRGRLRGTEVHLILGNHDRAAGPLPAGWGIEVHEGPFVDAHLRLMHEPVWAPQAQPADSVATAPGEPRLGLAGHLHPAARVRERRGGGLRARCFWLHRGVLVLPAFGSFTGGARVQAEPGDRVFMLGPDAVVEVPLAALT